MTVVYRIGIIGTAREEGKRTEGWHDTGRLLPTLGIRTDTGCMGGVGYKERTVLTPLGPQSRFGDKLLIIRVLCPNIWECGVKWVNAKTAHIHFCATTLEFYIYGLYRA